MGLFLKILNSFKSSQGTFVIFKGVDKKWRFHLKAPNGEIIAASEGYSTEMNCRKGIEAVIKYSKRAIITEQ